MVGEEFAEEALAQLGVDGLTGGQGREFFPGARADLVDGFAGLFGDGQAEAADVGVAQRRALAQFDHELVVGSEHERFGEGVDGDMRFGLVRAEGAPAVTRIVVQRILHVAVAAVLLLIGHRVGDGVGHEDVLDLVVAPGPHLELEVGELELAVLAAGESAAGVRGVREDFQAQPGDAREAVMADDPVFVLVGVRARSLDGAVGFLPEQGAFGGLEVGGPDDLPGLPSALGGGAALLQPAGERSFGLLSGGGFGGFDGVDELLGFGDRAGGMFRLIGQEGLRAAAGLAVLVDAVEEGRQGVVIGLGDGVELVGVTLRAAERHPQPRRAHGVHAVQHVIDPRLLGVAAAFAIGHVIALEAGRELLLGGRVRQEVAGELFERELVVRDVAVEGLDDPVAPRPVAAGGVRLEAVGVRIAGGVEPPHGHTLAIMRRG